MQIEMLISITPFIYTAYHNKASTAIKKIASRKKKFLLSFISVGDEKIQATATIAKINRLEPSRTPRPS
jgi:hypothetical protein